jgi:tRNA threonylcarbamoyladenosine biosynthesis protein TsaB
LGLILNIETSTKTCSIAIGDKGSLFAAKEIKSDQFVHGEKLHLLIKDLLLNYKINISDLDAIAIGSGPGSFTGLRIGVATAKGLSYALKIPLISIMTLDLMMECYNPKLRTENLVFLPMLDARRDEVYTAGYDANKKMILKVRAQIVNEEFLNSLSNFEKIYFLGEGAFKFKNSIKQKNLIIDNIHLTSAKGMVSRSYQKFLANDFEDLAYFNPYYLKDFIANKKNN